MRKFVSALCAAALVAAGCAVVTPAVAQPARIIVRGATPLVVPPLRHDSYSSSYVLTDPANFGEDPFSFYYDPAGKVPNQRYYGPPAVDLVLARTLNRNNESIMGHIQACQARYPTYNPATNNYYGPNGLPVPCYF